MTQLVIAALCWFETNYSNTYAYSV